MHREQLNYFIAVYQQRNFTHAAEKMFITPQGIAKSLRSLEKELGVPLIVSRNDGSLLPTPYGEKVYEYALRSVEWFAELESEFAAIKAQEGNLLKLGISYGLLDTIGVSFLNQFQAIHPGTAIAFSEDPDEACEEYLTRGFSDLAFTMAPFNEEFETKKLGSVPLNKWVHTSNPLSKADVITVEDLRDNELATPGAGFKSYDLITKLCMKRDVTPKKIHPSYDRSWIYDFVLNNKGIGTNVGLILDIDLTTKSEIVELPFENIFLDFGISWRKDEPLTELQSVFVKQVCSFFE